MAFLKPYVKKMVILVITICTVALLSAISFNAIAQDQSQEYLKIIAEKTTGILEKVNAMPEYIDKSLQFYLAWTSKDDSDTTTTLLGDFTNLTNAITQNYTFIDPKNGWPQKMANDYFTANGDKSSYVTQNNLVTAIPQVNDLTYQTILGTPFIKKDPRGDTDPRGNKIDIQYNYLQNASGLNVQHVTPGKPGYSWGQGKPDDKAAYINYYNTVSAVQTYNGYILSELYADFKNGQQQNAAQQALIQDASDTKKWFAQVGSENIGIVLRQILLFESQSFLYLVRMYDLQQKMLATQAMTNTLLITLNQQGEPMMVRRATNASPG